MIHIVVDDRQAKLIAEATEGVEIRDSQGRHLGFIAHDFSADDVVTARRRLASVEPRYTTSQVLDHLRAQERK